jgi:putative peptidoglycan lipid II flippase
MSLLRATATIGGFTMVSRLLGFVRDQLIAWALGTGPISDAYYVAIRLPSMFRVLFAEGAFSAAFVPVFARRLEADGKDGARRYAEQAISLLLAAALATLLLAELFMPWAVRAIAPGFAGDTDQFDLTVALTRVTFPYLVFITLASLQGGILNSLNRFAAAAVTPVLLNLFQIGAVIWSWRFGNAGGDVASEHYAAATLSWCFTAGGIAQFLWLMLSCARVGMALRLRWPHLTAEMRRLGKLMLWGIIGGGATQINLLISTEIASTLPSGSVSYLQYGDRVNQLPLAVIGIAIGTAILPTLSRRLQAGDEAGATHLLRRAADRQSASRQLSGRAQATGSRMQAALPGRELPVLRRRRATRARSRRPSSPPASIRRSTSSSTRARCRNMPSWPGSSIAWRGSAGSTA